MTEPHAEPHAELHPVLAARPSIEVATAALEEVVTQVLDAVDAALGPQGWQVRPNGVTAGCAELPGAGGQSRTLDLRFTPSGIDDDRWPLAQDAALAVAQRHGFGEPEIVVDRPGDHEVRATDGVGALLVLGTARRTTLMVSTGCHLPAEVLAEG